MRKISNLLSGLFLVLVFILSIAFSYFNTTEVGLSFGSWQLPSQPVSVWIIGAFVVGGVLGLLLGLGIPGNLRSRGRIRRLNKELADARQEVSQLRSMSLKDLD